jgi:hypothetical protein
VRLRIAIVVLALIVVPAIAFAVAKSHPASPAVSPGTAYVTTIKTKPGDTTQSDANEWLRKHPDDHCEFQQSTAICTTNDPNRIVVFTTTLDSLTTVPSS